jgi:hypothetical protein
MEHGKHGEQIQAATWPQAAAFLPKPTVSVLTQGRCCIEGFRGAGVCPGGFERRRGWKLWVKGSMEASESSNMAAAAAFLPKPTVSASKTRPASRGCIIGVWGSMGGRRSKQPQ